MKPNGTGRVAVGITLCPGLAGNLGAQDAPAGPLDRPAGEGLRYPSFHVTALCSPARAALLAGRNRHTNNTGAVQDVAFPGNTGMRPASVAPLAEMLRLNRYNAAAFVFSRDEGADVGEDDDTPVTEAYVAGVKSCFTGKIHHVTVEAK